MKLARALILTQTPDLRQRAAALRNNVARKLRPKPAPTVPAPADVAAAIEIDALPVAELAALHDTAALIGEVCAAISCQPRCVEPGPDGTEQRSPAGRLAEWQRAVCGALMDRCVDRLGDVAEAARRDGAGELLAAAAEALRTRI